jgi:hypothetical protein
MLEPDDQESTGVSAVLYHDVNRELVAEAREAAADRRLAAWLFLARRYTAQEIAADPQRLAQFDFLTLRVKRWARKAKRTDLVDEINAVSRTVSDCTGQGDTAV